MGHKPALLAAILLCAAAAGALGAYLLAAQWYVLDTRAVPVRFEVSEGNAIGLDVDPSILAFGKVPQGGVAERSTAISSKIPAIAYVDVDEGLRGVLTPEAERVMLGAGNATQVRFTLSVPADMDPGCYSGMVRITYVRRLWWQ